ncbi:hypothetical protein [Rufibacter psychrotolerans]|uniref:hypothetical protein n=1 Tax=Rufibacter psychrotolerans TaxID=2812556 RepID=UPI0019680E5F|nr:hypothetical protein [Rufibacter sp. SYSU D00308]
MKAKLLRTSMLVAATALAFGCSPEEDELLPTEVPGGGGETPAMGSCETITFDKVTRGADGFVHAVMSDQASTPILVRAFRKTAPNTYGPTNVANIFDSGQTGPLGNDVDDILTPHKDFGGWGVGDGGKKGKAYQNDKALGSLMIVNRTDNSSQAYDNNGGGKLEFDFSGYGAVTMNSITVMDVDSYEKGSKVVLYGLNSKVLKTVNMAVSGNNGKQVLDLGGTAGVVRMEVYLGPTNSTSGSGAIDDIVFNCASAPVCETVTFTRFRRGSDGFVSEVTSNESATPILVSAFRKTAANTYSAVNAANIFNSSQPTSIGNQVTDILTPHMNFGGGGVGDGGAGGAFANNTPLGNLLIINRTTNPMQAYDYNGGGKMVFDFSRFGSVSLSSVTVMDVDDYEAGAKIMLYGPGNVVLKTVPMAVSGNNGKQTVDLGGTPGVTKMEIYVGPTATLTGSGAIDNILFNCPPRL